MDLRYDLAEAAREGRAKEVSHLLRSGADPRLTTKGAYDHGAFLDQVTPLMIAAGSPRSNLATVDALLAGGADLRQRASGGVTAAWYAAGGGTGYPLTEQNLAKLAEQEANHDFCKWGGGDADRLARLLDLGADPNETADNGRSLLCEACHLGDPLRVKLLLDRGARWDLRAMRFINPLFNATESGSAECVKLLLDAGFPAQFENKGKNALHHVSNAEVAAVLLEAGLAAQQSRWGHDPIHEALENEAWDAARFLIERMPGGPARQAALRREVLMFSGSYAHPTALRILIEVGAEVRFIDPDYGSPLHAACWQGGSEDTVDDELARELLGLLIDHGAEIDLRDSRGNTPLHEAAEGDWASPTAVKFLIERGAEVDPMNAAGKTPLMLATDQNSLACVRILLNAGADPQPARKIAKSNMKYHRGAAKARGIFTFSVPTASQNLEMAVEISRLIG